MFDPHKYSWFMILSFISKVWFDLGVQTRIKAFHDIKQLPLRASETYKQLFPQLTEVLLQVVTTTWVSFPRCQSCWCLVEKHKVSNGIPAVTHSVAILGQNRERSHSQLIMYSMGACKGRPCFNLNSLQCLKNKQEVKATARTIRRVKIKQNKKCKVQSFQTGHGPLADRDTVIYLCVAF